MRKSEPPGFCPRLGYLAFSFASSAFSGRIPSFSCVSCFSSPVSSAGFSSSCFWDMAEPGLCNAGPGKSAGKGNGLSLGPESAGGSVSRRSLGKFHGRAGQQRQRSCGRGRRRSRGNRRGRLKEEGLGSWRAAQRSRERPSSIA